MKIGAIIRQRRNELHMTQKQLANAVFVTEQAVSQWEHDVTIPDIVNLGPIAKALRISKEDLMSDEIKNTPTWIVNDQFFSEKNMARKLKEFADAEGLKQTKRAVDFAFEKHSDRNRKQSVFSDKKVPAIVHSYTMACHAHAIGIKEDTVLATALLHDVCEDCNVSMKNLPFSDEVKEAVALLTKADDYDNDSYYAGIAGNSTAAIVKVIDR